MSKQVFEEITSKLGYKDKYGNSIRTKKVRLTATQVKALFTTPQTLVPAPKIDEYAVVEKIVMYLDYSGAVFTGANNLEFRETNGAGTKVTADITAAALNGAADAVVEVGDIEAQTTRLLNKPIVVAVPVANPGGASATSKVTFITFYRIVKVTGL